MKKIVYRFGNLLIPIISILWTIVLPGQNQRKQSEVEFKSVNKVIRITADSTTSDQKFGDSYRVLLIFQKENEEKLKQIKRIVLPINISPDFPYKLTKQYDKESKFVLVQGFSILFIYDVLTDSLSKAIVPIFKNPVAVDAQTGHLENLKISKNGKLLTGYAMDLGEFRFDLSNLMEPKQIH